MATLVDRQTAGEGDRPAALPRLVLGALGVVFGDIGTSPLYTIKETFGEAGGLQPSASSVLGVLSLIFWSLVIVVTVKYVWLVLRADNRGEGGILAVSSLALRAASGSRWRHGLVVALSIAGLSLFYGDGLITPAISVLSAVEGLEVALPPLAPYVLPIAIAVLVGLFVLQQFGTERVGALFGPIICVWFVTLAVLGLAQIVQHPAVLRALDPTLGIGLFVHQPWHAFVALGAIVLAVTGAEALYADMGHFGRLPIRIGWLGLVLPSLVLNYFGQGALVLRDTAAVANPFYYLAPGWFQIPLVLLATMATIIASQAVISGVFSLTRQGIQLGYLPRMTVRHTSPTEQGQIYIPQMNWLLLAGVIGLVLGFGSSSNLAAAYGISVTGAMGIDAILVGLVAAWIWGWPAALAAATFGFFMAIDIAYISANALKIPSGGWFPLLIAVLGCYLVVTWRRGRKLVWDRLYAQALPTTTFIDKATRPERRVAGTAVFMTGNPELIPNALLHNMKHNKVLHERVVLMRVRFLDVPYIADDGRLSCEALGNGFYRVEARYGFLDQPDVPRALDRCADLDFAFEPMTTSYFLGRETYIASKRPEMGALQERLFIFMTHIAVPATAYFRIPPDRVVELGTQLEI